MLYQICLPTCLSPCHLDAKPLPEPTPGTPNSPACYCLPHQSRVIEEALQAARLPACLPLGRMPFWASEEVLDMVALLQLTAFPSQLDLACLQRLVMHPDKGLPASK